VTDANLVLGRLLAEQPLAGEVRLDRAAAERVVGVLAHELGIEPIACAEGIVRVAETEMLRALTVMTVERGIDPRRFALMPFGGAGPLHAAAMARELAIMRVLCPRASGVLCALGLAAAAPRRDASSTVMLAGDSLSAENLASELGGLVERASAELDDRPSRIDVSYELRYQGQSFELTVEDASTPEELVAAFEAAHEQRYGYRDERAEVELVNIRVSAIGAQPALRLKVEKTEPPVRACTPVVFDGETVEAELWQGELPGGMHVRGPALCALPHATLLVPPDWSGVVDEYGTIALERDA
jgi:N-methylhydantoinase A